MTAVVVIGPLSLVRCGRACLAHGSSGSVGCSFEQFDHVAGRILHQDLASALPLDPVTPERDPSVTEFVDERVQVIGLDTETIPTARRRVAASCARAAGSRLVEEQHQVVTAQTGEPRGWVHLDLEAQPVPVKLDRRIDVVDDVANTGSHWGSPSTRIEAVADEASVAKSTIYRHWPSKLSLIADSLETLNQQPTPDIGDGNARERIGQLLQHLASAFQDSVLSACIPALVEAAEHRPEIAEFLHGYNARRRQKLIATIAGGIEAGELPGHLDPELTALALIGPVIYNRTMTPDPLTPGQAERLADMILRESTPARLSQASNLSPPRRPCHGVQAGDRNDVEDEHAGAPMIGTTDREPSSPTAGGSWDSPEAARRCSSSPKDANRPDSEPLPDSAITALVSL